MAVEAEKPDDEEDVDLDAEAPEVVDPVDEVAADEQADDQGAAADDDAEDNEPPAPQLNGFEQLGDEFKGLSPGQAVARVGELRQRAAEAEQYQRHQQWTAWQLQQEQAKQQELQRQIATQPQKPATPEKPKRVVPEYDPSWRNQLTRDDKGNVVLMPGAQPDLLTKIQAYADWQAKEEQRFFSDPSAYFMDLAGDQLRQTAQEVFQSQMQAMQADYIANQRMQQLAQHENQHRDLYYDNQGRPTPILNAVGTSAKELVTRYGINDPSKASELALMELQNHALREQNKQLIEQSAATQTAAGKNKAIKTAFNKAAVPVAGVKRQPGRKAGASETTRMPDFKTMLRQDMQKAGLLPQQN